MHLGRDAVAQGGPVRRQRRLADGEHGLTAAFLVIGLDVGHRCIERGSHARQAGDAGEDQLAQFSTSVEDRPASRIQTCAIEREARPVAITVKPVQEAPDFALADRAAILVDERPRPRRQPSQPPRPATRLDDGRHVQFAALDPPGAGMALGREPVEQIKPGVEGRALAGLVRADDHGDVSTSGRGRSSVAPSNPP